MECIIEARLGNDIVALADKLAGYGWLIASINYHSSNISASSYSVTHCSVRAVTIVI